MPIGARASQSQGEKAVDVAVAEFNALRAEIIQLNTAQAAFVGISITALGVVIGLGVRKDDRLLLIIPPLAILVTLVYAGYAFRASEIGRYIGTKLWPYLQQRVGDVPSWEAYINAQRLGRRGVVRALTDASAPVLYAGASLVVLIEVKDGATSELKTLGWVCFAAVALLLAGAAGLSLARGREETN